ncbi:MAG: 60S ribosomal protein L22 [Candidatus Atabeyarchaeum deiterrae]
MSQIFVESGELKKHGNDLMKKLAEFINGIAALKVDAKVDGDDVALTPKPFTQKTGKKVGGKKKKGKGKIPAATEAPTISKTKLKVYLKRFLNKQKVDHELRVVSDGEDAFIFRERPISEENLAPLEEK